MKPPEKTPAMIAEEKLAAMAKDPNAVTVYKSIEKGFDAESWNFLFPEVQIFNKALKEGYGWYDIMYDRGRHLIPKPIPYKVVEVPDAELKRIRAEQKRKREEAEQKDAKARQEYWLSVAQKEKQQETERIAKECARMAAEDDAARQRELPSVIAAIVNTLVDTVVAKIDAAAEFVESTLQAIRELPIECLYADYLAEYIADRIGVIPREDHDGVIAALCPRIEKEGLLFVTPTNSPPPELEAVFEPQEPVVVHVPYCEAPPVLPHMLVYPPNPLQFFLSPPVVINGATYIPSVDPRGGCVYLPEAWTRQARLPPLPSPPTVAPPLPPPLPPIYPPPLPSTFALTSSSQPPLPKHTRLPPLLPTPTTPPLVFKKVRIPNLRRIQKFLQTVENPVMQKRSLKRDWKDSVQRNAMIAGFAH